MHLLRKHLERLQRSLGRRFREWRLPSGYRRFGTRYGGWWLDTRLISKDPLLVDCGLGEDISFPLAFLERFGGRVIGVEPNPRSLAYCRTHCPPSMEVRPCALWKTAGETVTFYLPRPQDQLPEGADGVSGSLLPTHHYVIGGDTISATTTTLGEVLDTKSRRECDVLKLDIEGAEYEVLTELCGNGDIRRTRQLLVEFHHGGTHRRMEDTEAAAAALRTAGFWLVHVEHRNYIFRRDDPLPSQVIPRKP